MSETTPGVDVAALRKRIAEFENGKEWELLLQHYVYSEDITAMLDEIETLRAEVATLRPPIRKGASVRLLTRKFHDGLHPRCYEVGFMTTVLASFTCLDDEHNPRYMYHLKGKEQTFDVLTAYTNELEAVITD